MAKHKLLRISSQDRADKNNSTSDFNVTINNKVELQQIKKIVVKQVSIPNTAYNINAGNNTFSYSIGNFVLVNSVTVPVGQYTLDLLITALITAVGAHPLSPLVMTITQDSLTKKLAWTSDISIKWYNADDASPLGEVMGITTSTSVDSDTHTSAGLPALEGHNTLYVESTNLARENLIRTNGHSSNVLCVVPITVEWGGIEHYLSPHAELDDIISTSSAGNNKQDIDIKIVSRDGTVIDLNGHHVTVILKMYY